MIGYDDNNAPLFSHKGKAYNYHHFSSRHVFLIPLIQLISTPLAFVIWFIDLQQKPLSSIPYIAFSILFGMFISLHLFAKNKCFDCKVEGKARTGFAGSVVGFMVGVCPACFSFLGVLLPLGPTLFLTSYSPIFTGISIAIVLFSIYKLGGFKKTQLNLMKKG